jgi:hypothetical protein
LPVSSQTLSGLPNSPPNSSDNDHPLTLRRTLSALSFPDLKGWSRKFDDPIDLPKGRKLVTLKGKRQAEAVQAL